MKTKYLIKSILGTKLKNKNFCLLFKSPLDFYYCFLLVWQICVGTVVKSEVWVMSYNDIVNVLLYNLTFQRYEYNKIDGNYLWMRCVSNVENEGNEIFVFFFQLFVTSNDIRMEMDFFFFSNQLIAAIVYSINGT